MAQFVEVPWVRILIMYTGTFGCMCNGRDKNCRHFYTHVSEVMGVIVLTSSVCVFLCVCLTLTAKRIDIQTCI